MPDSSNQTLLPSTKPSFPGETALDPELVTSFTARNYCYVCKKPQSKISRHFKKHEEEPAIAEAFSFPKKIQGEEKIRENQRNREGQLKIKRRPSRSKIAAKIHNACPLSLL